MKELDLKKCPFCGGSAFVIKRHGIFWGIGYQVKCSHCETVSPIEEAGTKSVVDLEGFHEINISDVEAINMLSTRWNTRQNT